MEVVSDSADFFSVDSTTVQMGQKLSTGETNFLVEVAKPARVVAVFGEDSTITLTLPSSSEMNFTTAFRKDDIHSLSVLGFYVDPDPPPPKPPDHHYSIVAHSPPPPVSQDVRCSVASSMRFHLTPIHSFSHIHNFLSIARLVFDKLLHKPVVSLNLPFYGYGIAGLFTMHNGYPVLMTSNGVNGLERSSMWELSLSQSRLPKEICNELFMLMHISACPFIFIQFESYHTSHIYTFQSSSGTSIFSYFGNSIQDNYTGFWDYNYGEVIKSSYEVFSLPYIGGTPLISVLIRTQNHLSFVTIILHFQMPWDMFLLVLIFHFHVPIFAYVLHNMGGDTVACDFSLLEILFGKVPMLVELSLHGYFGLSNALGLLDIGEQVVYQIDRIHTARSQVYEDVLVVYGKIDCLLEAGCTFMDWDIEISTRDDTTTKYFQEVANSIQSNYPTVALIGFEDILQQPIILVHEAIFQSIMAHTRDLKCFEFKGLHTEPPCYFLSNRTDRCKVGSRVLNAPTFSLSKAFVVIDEKLANTSLYENMLLFMSFFFNPEQLLFVNLGPHGYIALLRLGRKHQWDLSEHFQMSNVLQSFQFKQWDPGKKFHGENFYNLEDKVDCEGVGNDMIIGINGIMTLLAYSRRDIILLVC